MSDFFNSFWKSEILSLQPRDLSWRPFTFQYDKLVSVLNVLSQKLEKLNLKNLDISMKLVRNGKEHFKNSSKYIIILVRVFVRNVCFHHYPLYSEL